MKIAVIGCGYISRVHLAAIKKFPGITAVAVADNDIQKARERAHEFHVPRAFSDWNEAFALDEVEGAILCLPHQLHYPCAMDALKAGKHILVEKPISIAMQEANRLIALAARKKLILMVAHMKRFDRRFTAMKARIDEGCIGKVFLAKSEWIGPREVFKSNPWTAFKAQGGGPLMGFGSHHIDLLQWMVGPITKVSCFTNNLIWPKVEVEDSAVAVVEFANKAIGSLIYTWGAEIHGQSENLLICGSAGSLKLDNEDLYLTSEKIYGDRTPHPLDTRRSDQQDIGAFGKELALSSLEPFVLELQHFAECVANRKTPLIDGKTAARSVDVIRRAYRSAERNKRHRTT